MRPDAKRVAALHLAGVFEAPPRMVEAVSKVVMEEWVARVLYGIEDKKQMWRRAIAQEKTKGQDPEAIEDYETLLSDMIVLENRVSREYPRVKPKPVPSTYVTVKIPTDLRGWRYERRYKELIEEMPPRERELFLDMEHKHISVAITFDAPKRALGTWHSIGLLQIWVEEDIDNYEFFKFKRQGYLKTIRHEVQHMGQTTLSAVVRRAKRDDWYRAEDPAGLPPRRTREQGTTPGGYPVNVRRQEGEDNRIEHAQRDVEFYTRLQDEIEAAQKLKRYVPRKYWAWAVDNWVGDRGAPLPPSRKDGKSDNPYVSEADALKIENLLKRRYRFNDKDLTVLRQLEYRINELRRSLFFPTLRQTNKPKWHKAIKEFTKALDR